VDGLRFWQSTSQAKWWPDKASNVIRVWCTMCLTLGQRSWTRYESHSFMRYHELYESHHCKLRYHGLYEAQSCKLRVWFGIFTGESIGHFVVFITGDWRGVYTLKLWGIVDWKV
jgi:hypothetical protein